MLPLVTIEKARLADGSEFTLSRRGNEWSVRVGSTLLMSSRSHESEELLAEHALTRAPAAAQVLVGGLGLGFTLRAVLDRVSSATKVTVAELVPELVTWNRVHVGALANHPLLDERTELVVGDVMAKLKSSARAYDVILLDVDNGPIALSSRENQRLYSKSGIRACRGALKHGGILAVWSAGPSPHFEQALWNAGFKVEVLRPPASKTGGARHAIIVASLAARGAKSPS